MRIFRIICAVLMVAACAGLDAYGQEAVGSSKAALKAGPEYLKAIREAALSYSRRDFETALKQLDAADKIRADLPEALNLRGAAYAEQHDFDRARATFEKALKVQPDSFWPKFNLAEILLMQKKAAEAREAFAKLPVAGAQRELVQFKIILTHLLENDDANAKAKLEQMKFPGDSAAYYFAHAAWEFAHQSPDKGNDWIKSAHGIFGKTRCLPFYDSLADMGWVEKRAAAVAPEAAAAPEPGEQK